MAKGRKRSSSGYPDPISGALSLLGAVAMGAYARHKVKRDYAKGEGEDSVKAAMAVFGPGSFRRGTAGAVSLGGLFGVNSAIKDINKSAARPVSKPRAPRYDGGPDLSVYNKTNDNRYAWRLNCEDGSAYGIDPGNYETREAYNGALRDAKEGYVGAVDFGDHKQANNAEPEAKVNASEPTSKVYFCRISLLTNGKTEYFRTDDQTIKRGDVVTVPDGKSTATGVVVSIDRCSPSTYPQPLEKTPQIIGRAT